MRYILFAGYQYYPSGGMEDFEGAFDSLEEAQQSYATRKNSFDWANIVDTANPNVFMRADEPGSDWKPAKSRESVST